VYALDARTHIEKVLQFKSVCALKSRTVKFELRDYSDDDEDYYRYYQFYYLNKLSSAVFWLESTEGGMLQKNIPYGTK